ncbi:MAG: hypothetical protein N2315_00490 [Thermanaerothrix sp.]|nr:hypothetical protein [Thermanaerothrix sp.]
MIRGEYLVRRILGRSSYVRSRWLLNGVLGSVEEVDPKRPLELQEGVLPHSDGRRVLDFRVSPDEAEQRVRLVISDVGFWGRLAGVMQGVNVSATPFYARYCIHGGELFDPFGGEKCTDPLFLGLIDPRPGE